MKITYHNKYPSNSIASLIWNMATHGGSVTMIPARTINLNIAHVIGIEL